MILWMILLREQLSQIFHSGGREGNRLLILGAMDPEAVPARSRGRQYCRRHAKSCELATPTVVRSNGLAPALPALHGAQAKQSPDRRPARASRLPLSASDSSCHGAAD